MAHKTSQPVSAVIAKQKPAAKSTDRTVAAPTRAVDSAAYASLNLDNLQPADLLTLQRTIGNHATTRHIDAWFDRYIFPNGKLPSVCEIARALEGRFLVEDWHNFGQDYDRTLMAWWANFDAAWPRLQQKYGERFHRRWKYYLMCCAGLFRSRQGQLWQLALSKRQRVGQYRSVR